MEVKIAPKIRLAIYIIFGVAATIVTYLLDTEHIGLHEVKLFTGLSAFAYGLAAIKTPINRG